MLIIDFFYVLFNGFSLYVENNFFYGNVIVGQVGMLGPGLSLNDLSTLEILIIL